MLKKLLKNKYLYTIIAIIQFLLTFFTDKIYFYMDQLNVLNYTICKIIVLVILLCFWKFIYYIIINKKKDWIKYFLIYFIPMIIILILIFPGFMYGADIYNFINLSHRAELLYSLNYLSSLFWICSIMLFPVYSMVIVIQVFVMSMVITFIRIKLEKLFPKNKYNNLIYLIGFMFSSIMYMLYPNRPIIYGILYLLMFSILFFDVINKEKLSIIKLVIICILGGILSFWRTEGIYLLLAIPILLVVIYNIKIKSKEFILVCLIPILTYCFISIPQTIYKNRENEFVVIERNFPNIVSPLSYMLNQKLDNDNLERDLKIINKVLDISKIKKTDSLDEAYALWLDGGCIKKGYSLKEFEEMQKAYYNIVKNNIGIYLKAKTITFYHATRLKYDHFHSCNLFDNSKGGIYDNSIIKAFIKSRTIIVKTLEGHDYPVVLDQIYKIFNSLLLPLLTLLLSMIVSFIKKKHKIFLLTGMLIGHCFLVFIVAPASYFMYYFPAYLCGYMILCYYVIRIINIKKAKKSKQGAI